MQKDDLKGAESLYRAALIINPDNINAAIGLAKVQRQQGHYLDAQNSYANALSRWPDFPEAHANLAVLYDLYLNNAELAQQHMEAYLFLNGYRDKQVLQWFEELKQRTGITGSIIDTPPVMTAITVAPAAVVENVTTAAGDA